MVDEPSPRRSPPPGDHWAPDHVLLGGEVLTYAGRLLVERDPDGQVLVQSPVAGMAAVDQRYPAWARGPFGRIEPERDLPALPGVFALVESGLTRYVGSADDLARFFGVRSGLGEITRRDVRDGEERCRLNRLVTDSARAGRTVDLYLRVTGPRSRSVAALVGRRRGAPRELAASIAERVRGAWHLPT